VKFVETPLAAIRTAKQSLYYAWFLHEAAERGAITPEAFTNEIPEGQMKLRWPPENRTPAALAGWSWNAVLAAMSISAIAATARWTIPLVCRDRVSAHRSNRRTK
jgi:hypothetical protein